MGTAKKAVKSTAPKEKKAGIGDVAIEAIRAGKNNQEALAAVKKKFPGAATQMSSINWYRNKLRSEGEKVKTAREMRKEEKKKKQTAGDPTK